MAYLLYKTYDKHLFHMQIDGSGCGREERI